MNFYYLLFICIASQGGICSSLRCWKCENARSPSECILNGESQLCRSNEKACQTEVRYSNGWGRRANIRTSCKEAHACGNNFKQNNRPAWSPTQCNGGTDNSVCRCCCNRYHCNRQTLLCQPRVCDAISAPENGKVRCNGTGSTEVGEAKCVFTCNNGYQLVGSTTTDCIDTPEGPKWSREVPTCKGICDSVSTPENGRAECNGSNEVDQALCVFRCNEGYQLVGSETTSCIGTVTGPDWSNSVPTCRGICDSVRAPESGRVDCTGSNVVNRAVCVFQCNEGYRLDGSPNTSCITTTNGPGWDNDIPTCTGICPEITAPEDGEMECTGPNEVNKAVCGFRCDEGFKSDGAETTSCIETTNGPEWSNDVPKCTGICDPISAPDNGTVDCTGSFEVDKAVCVFRCNNGFDLLGFENTSCIAADTGPRWSRDVPACKDRINTPEIPAETTTVKESISVNTTAKPTPPSPICNDLGELPNGVVVCTNDDNRVGTTCSFRCNGDYMLIPSNRTSTKCEITDGETKWSNRKPCCSTQCPPVAKKDIVLVIDSSNSINIFQWKMMKEFIEELIKSFTISADAVRVAAFTFSDGIKNNTQIFFGDYNDKDLLIKNVKNVGRLKKGTKIGNALKHARDNILPKNNRPEVDDMIFVITDGKSEDEFDETAQQLRKEGVQIVALGIFGDQRDKVIPQLEVMTGDKESVFEVKSFADFKSVLLTKIVEKMCELSCNK